jgi:hypothetical protein
MLERVHVEIIRFTLDGLLARSDSFLPHAFVGSSKANYRSSFHNDPLLSPPA